MKKPALGVLLAALLLVPRAFAGDLSTCATVAACNQEGTAAYKAKKYGEAIGHFENQIDFAEIAQDEKAQILALNNLALAHLKKGEPLRAKAWVLLAEDFDATDKATLFNRAEIEKALAATPARPPIAGEYIAYIGSGQWNFISLEAKDKNVYKMTLLALRMGNQWREWGPAGIGELEEEITVKGDRASFNQKFEFADEPCKIDFLFAVPDEMEVDQLTNDMACGFGNAVAATGHYYRVEPTSP